MEKIANLAIVNVKVVIMKEKINVHLADHNKYSSKENVLMNALQDIMKIQDNAKNAMIVVMNVMVAILIIVLNVNQENYYIKENVF